MKRFAALALVLGLVLVVAGCPAAPEAKDTAPALDPMPTPADVPQDGEPAPKTDAPPAEEAEKQLPPLPKESAEPDAPTLVPADAPTDKPAEEPSE